MNVASACPTAATSLTYAEMLTFVETKLFTQPLRTIAAMTNGWRFKNAIVANPEAGDVIRGSGGVRELR